ncbi:hypothetical protein KIH31_10455 [Paenarthrobacter sp. DKR-5]|uniref:hypothetical protein n=1 Tax=Paenarthrobacter sp. DKR-5 TaxID=2835535 RepID=UPI001BDC547A|nr:hypothetical protein [Paenarthrobacter sp. DKR-5]MBT1003029.1 hypothetical protein [Paenarthrobacter sp. DKR-5]
MPRSGEPRVTHFNDCAFVAKTLVDAAAAQGHRWGYLPPGKVRPEGGFSSSAAGRLRQLPYVARHLQVLLSSDVLHIHYATAAALLEKSFYPRRPYLLTLHGSDIRKQWLDPAYHDQIQRAIDGASMVFYANLDTAENALKARPDAVYMPPLLRPGRLPQWTPASTSGAPRVVFASRWDESKGVEAQLELAAALRAALPPAVDLVGLDWGPGAARAQKLGVRLVPRMEQPDYLRLLASADLVVGQPQGILATSELEAMAIGVPLACPGRQLEGPGGTPPVLQGTVAEIVEQTKDVLADPAAASAALNARPWVLEHNTADAWIPLLSRAYSKAAAEGVRR